MWQLNIMLIKKTFGSLKKSKKKFKKIPRNKWQWKHDNSKHMGCSKSSSKREVYSNTVLSQETIIIPDKHSNLMSKATRHRRADKAQS